MDSLYPEKNRFDPFIVDGYSNVQVEGEIVDAVFIRVHTIHGADHFFDILFDDIVKIPEIKVSELCDTSSILFYH